jgi:hypothetical protein
MIGVKDAVLYSMKNKANLEDSSQAGCYYCYKIFDPQQITEYTDEGKTAICPFCKVDAVLPNLNLMEFSEEFLKKTHKHWFGD